MSDYIDREALPGKLERGYIPDDDFNAGWNACLNAIASTPAADVAEVRHERWERSDDGYGSEDLWRCSACKEEFFLIAGTPRDNGYYYCPNCGAKMDESEDIIVLDKNESEGEE